MPKTSPKPELRAKILEYRANGHSFLQIGQTLGISRSAVAGYVYRDRQSKQKQIEEKVLPALEKELVDAI